MTCTQVRHLAASIISTVLPEDAKKLARYMCHDSKTQQATYNDCLLSSEAVRMSNLVHKVMSEQEIVAEDLVPASYGECHEL